MKYHLTKQITPEYPSGIRFFLPEDGRIMLIFFPYHVTDDLREMLRGQIAFSDLNILRGVLQ